MKVAVFGHYDSRGGTSAIPLPDNPTFLDLEDAKKRYDVEAFMIPEKDLGDREEWPTLPSESDFMYIADLHGDVELGVDLDNGLRSVLIDEATDLDNDIPPEQIDLSDRIELSFDKPVQLEAVTMPGGFDYDIKAHEKGVCEQRSVLCDGYLSSSEWTPEQVAHSERLNKIEEGLQAEREARIVAAAKILKGDRVKYRRWDDDAFGFILMGRS